MPNLLGVMDKKTHRLISNSSIITRTTTHSGESIVSIIQAERLEAKGLLNDQSSSLQIQGKCFRPGPAFSKQLREIAIEFCEEARSQGRQYILIEFPTYLMAWLRIQGQTPTQPLNPGDAETLSPALFIPKETSDPQPLPRQTVESATPTLSEEHNLLTPDGSGLNRDFLDQCKAELANHIGPMAHFITEQTLNKSPRLTRQQLIEALAIHIPDASTANSFRQAFQLPSTE